MTEIGAIEFFREEKLLCAQPTSYLQILNSILFQNYLGAH